MPSQRNFSRGLKALWQLGLGASLPYAGYQLKLRSGLLRLQTPVQAHWRRVHVGQPQPLFPLPDRGQTAALLGVQLKGLYAEADEILDGQVRLFGGESRPLLLDPGDQRHWSAYHSQLPDGSDIKATWEIGRFGWAITLARAFWLSGDENYARGFWRYTEEFLEANPPNQGPHWSSAQEVALRIIALGFCSTVFNHAQTSRANRKHLLASSLAAHAARIPHTLGYAIAQNNNHLLSEALGLLTVAALLPQHRYRMGWQRRGQRYFERGIRRQIDAVGAYNQHSANYQRLMLQLGLWAQVLARKLDFTWPADVQAKLAQSTHWLLALLDTGNGRLPNLGPNDGAYILPLDQQPFEDYRPTLQAASRAFLGRNAVEAGPWDELGAWLAPQPNKDPSEIQTSEQPLRLEGDNSWAYLRAATFKGRPGHADQLHLDLWWRGRNLARDAGSYRYNAPPPWDNALAASAVHNTLTINGRDQMEPAGRFLWLDWAQARVLEAGDQQAVVEHDGYRHLGLTHRRQVRVEGDSWDIHDRVFALDQVYGDFRARLHWLLPDWPYTLKDGLLVLQNSRGTLQLKITAPGANFALVRAGERVQGELETSPVLGWYSPSYDQKEPALSLIAELHGHPPLEFHSRWNLP